MAARPAGKPRPRLPLNLSSLLGPSAGARLARGPCVRTQHEGSRGAGGRGRARAGASLPRRRWQGGFPESCGNPGGCPKVEKRSSVEVAPPALVTRSGPGFGELVCPVGFVGSERLDRIGWT